MSDEQRRFWMPERFVDNNVSELNQANKNPIYGLEDVPISTLEEAVKSLISIVPNVKEYAYTAMQNCEKDSIPMTDNESAAIYLYTMQTAFFRLLNEKLRAEDRNDLKPWFRYLKLFLTALEKLPSKKVTLWRGVEGKVTGAFQGSNPIIWWGVNSCSTDVKAIEQFLANCNSATLFSIEAINGKDISFYSTFPSEKEVILIPGTYIRINSKPLIFEDRFFVVHLKEEGRDCKLKFQRFVHKPDITKRKIKFVCTFYCSTATNNHGIIETTRKLVSGEIGAYRFTF